MDGVSTSEALIMMGRVEGKVDTLISMQSATATRVDGVEERLNKVEVDVATLRTSVETTKNHSQSYFSNFTAVIAIIVAAIAAYLGYKP